MNTTILCFILVVVISILFILYTEKYDDTKHIFDEEPNQLLLDNNIDVISSCVIPLNIFQTWHTKHLPPFMAQCVASLKRDNPEFTHYLFDDKDCRKYIYNNFNENVLNAFDSLIPGAYKADLWRYCVLYKEGGIYLDIKYKCVDGFKLIELTDDEYFVKDRPRYINGRKGIYNGILACKAGNQILKKSIDVIVENVKNKYYGNNSCAPTGPTMIVRLFSPTLFNLQKLSYDNIDDNYYIFRNKDEKILTIYNEYRDEQKLRSETPHYDILWNKHNIYK